VPVVLVVVEGANADAGVTCFRWHACYRRCLQVYIEPLGSPASCSLAYASVCEPLAAVDAVFKSRGGTANSTRSYLFACFVKLDAL